MMIPTRKLLMGAMPLIGTTLILLMLTGLMFWSLWSAVA